MMKMTMPLVLVLAMAASGAAFAQDTGTAEQPAPADQAPAAGTTEEAPADTTTDSTTNGLSMGAVEGEAPADGPGSSYVAETHGDWNLNCVRVEEGQNEPCQLYQLLKDSDGNSVAEISVIALPPGQEAAAGATIVTPLETLLTEQIRLGVDGGKIKRYPFTFCAAIGCVSRVGFTAEEIAQFKNGNKATLTIVPLAAPDQKVDLNLSLKGFTAGFDAVTAKNQPAAE